MDSSHPSGLISVRSGFSVQETMDRLVAVAETANMRVFARVDHGAGAAEVGMELRPTQLLIFGNPRGGTPLMIDRQTAAIDLPIKALVWEDEDGAVRLSYNSGSWLQERHGLTPQSSDAVAAIDGGLAKLAAGATAQAD